MGYWSSVEMDYVDRAQTYAQKEGSWTAYLDAFNMRLDFYMRFGC